MTRAMTAAMVLALLAPASASARGEAAVPQKAPARVESLLACRAIADPQQRLTCYDGAAAPLARAIAERDLVIIDREQKRAANRSLFGFSVPNFGGLFGNDDKDQVRQIDSAVVGSRCGLYTGCIVTLADGSVWAQTSDTPFALEPRRGDKAIVKRGALGSFVMTVNRMPGVKVKRVG